VAVGPGVGTDVGLWGGEGEAPGREGGVGGGVGAPGGRVGRVGAGKHMVTNSFIKASIAQFAS
jgi:hypothetical protein